MTNFKQSSLETSDQIYEHYQSCLKTERATLKEQSGNWRKFAFLRGCMFLASLVPLGFAATQAWGISYGWLILSGVLFFGFLVLAFFHERMSRRIRLARLLVRIHQESVSRLDRTMEDVYLPPYTVPEAIVPVSADLDLFGQQSLFQLLSLIHI